MTFSERYNAHLTAITAALAACFGGEKRGFAFDDATATYTPDGRMKFIYLKDEFAGFAIHLLLK